MQAPDQGQGLLLGTYLPGVWYKVRIRYEMADPRMVQLSYWINDQFRGRQALPAQSFESSLAYVALVADEGTAWFDDVKVTQLQSPAAELLGLLPQQGGNAGSVTVTIATSGLDLSRSPTVKLGRAGEGEIVGQEVAVDRDDVAARFDLVGRSVGHWDLIVIDAAGHQLTLPGAFTVEAGGEAIVWVDLLGPSLIRRGNELIISCYFGNMGNIDALEVPFALEGIPADAKYRLDLDLGAPPGIPGASVDWSKIPIALDRNGLLNVPVLFPRIPAQTTFAFRVRITVDRQTAIALRASAGLPLSDNPTNTVACLEALYGYVREHLHLGNPANQNDKTDDEEKAFEWLRGSLKGENKPIPLLHEMLGATSIAIAVAVPEARLLQAVLAGSETVLYASEIVTNCTRTFQRAAEAALRVNVVNALDPNAKVGAKGIGDLHYLSSLEPLRYAVLFENLHTANAPAQDVIISDRLDLQKVDADTVSLGLIAFGEHLIIPPAGRSEYSGEVDLRPKQRLIVRVGAALNRATGVLTWRFSSIDPTTGLPPIDPLAGFLPPNVHSPEGAGSVSFTVMPTESLATGATILNAASITFDKNAPITTQSWLNTVDATAPTSRVLALDPVQSSSSFEVHWSGSDSEAGIKDFTIAVSRDGGPFSDWLVFTPSSFGVFTGDPGHSYSFRSTARDLTGNREPTHVTADATTSVQAGASTCIPGLVNLCLDRNRFRVDVAWKDFSGNEGVGKVVPYGSDDSGLFWFFNPQNWEMLVKVLDGCGVNQRFWIFSAATTTVPYSLRIVDTITGAVREYVNPVGRAAASIIDTSAFASCSSSLAAAAAGEAKLTTPLIFAAPARNFDVQAGCSPGSDHLCLGPGRFRVEVAWKDFQGHIGAGQAVPFGSDDSGLFWFFAPPSWEMLVKVLDGCKLNQHYWVFSAATTTVQYTLRVTDTRTGVVKEYFNPSGTAAAAVTDTGAFGTCP